MQDSGEAAEAEGASEQLASDGIQNQFGQCRISWSGQIANEPFFRDLGPYHGAIRKRSAAAFLVTLFVLVSSIISRMVLLKRIA